jgi:hypothetical protein
MRKYEPFPLHTEPFEAYKTYKIGFGLDQPEDFSRSTFKKVTEVVDVRN